MLRVAPYCRVSTDNDDQINSLENQIQYYSEFVQNNKNWVLVDMYVDEGITGTSTKKRKDFNRLMADAYNGKIDLIITKEVSRFARNTVDTLSFTRKLKEHNVGVYFINDNIDTRDKDGEFRLTIMASVAQEESRKTSERVKWGMKRQMERGFVFVTSMFGYDLYKGQLTINEKESEVIKRIFHKYVYEGKGIGVIANELINEGIPVAKRITKWKPDTIRGILSNEKYVGDLLQKKTVTPNYLEHKSVINDGFEEKIFIPNHHEAIIDRETWDLAQKEINKRQVLRNKKSRYSNTYWCSGKIICSECGSVYTHKTKSLKNSKYSSWACSASYYKNSPYYKCTNNRLNYNALNDCTIFTVNYLGLIDKGLINQLHDEIDKIYKNYEQTDVRVYKKKIMSIKEKKEQLIRMYLDQLITKEELSGMKLNYDNQINGLELQIDRIELVNKKNQNPRENLLEIHKRLTQIEKQEVPTTVLYKHIIEKIIKHPNNKLDFYFKNMEAPVCVEFTTSGRGDKYKTTCQVVRCASQVSMRL